MIAARMLGMAVLIAVVCFLIKMTDSPEFRYSKYACQFEMIYNETGPIDLVVIGSSRSLQGVDAEILAKQRGGGVVYNLAKNWRGEGINYRLLRDAIEERDVDVALVEANLPEGQIYHAHFFVVGTLGDWFKSLRFRSAGEFNPEVLGATLRKLIERITEQFSLYLAGGLNTPVRLEQPRLAKTAFCRTREERVRTAYLETQKERYFKYYEGKSWSWDFDDPKSQHDLGFFKSMAELAESNSVQLVFYHINQAYYSTLDPDFAIEFENRIGAPLLIPPASLTREVEAMTAYADGTHMVAEGRAVYTNWLAKALNEL